MEYTKEQLQAITDHPQGNILVSASAGSGKTRVLVDRIIKLIETHQAQVDQLLVVTFTKAAAKEMRDRLVTTLKAHYQEVTDVAEKRYLLTQIQKVPTSDITTMDAYCQKLVSRYYYILGIDPNFRIVADETEQGLIKDRVWEDLREELYTNDEDGSFLDLVANFSNDRNDDGLTNVIYEMYKFANVNEDPEAWLDQAAAIYQVNDQPISETNFYQSQLLPEIKATLEQAVTQCEIGGFNAQKAELVKAEKDFNDIKQAIENVLANLATASFDELRNLIVELADFSRAPVDKNLDDYQKSVREQNKPIRDVIKKGIQELNERFFLLNETQQLALMKRAQKIAHKLIAVVKQFQVRYQAAKTTRKVMEFIDVEHAAYQILTAPTEQAQGIRQRLGQQYYEIMVDEYQDNNRLQDAILNQLANSNRFMVGDVKQSIYRFRLSDPSMFIEKQHQYQLADTEDELITLAQNFRSQKNIADFTNLIFNQVMDVQYGEIDYQKEGQLVYGAKYYPAELVNEVSLLLYNDSEKPAADKSPQPAVKEFSDAEAAQIEMIAQSISQLMTQQMPIYDKQLGACRPVEYGDIAIISPTHSSEFLIADVFEKYQIPAEISGAKSYFKTTEIQIMMALLTVIDNPHQDIPLVAVLKSPMVGLNENELAYLRIQANTGNYYQSLLEFHRNYQEMADYQAAIFAKVDRFLKQLTSFKDLANQGSIVDVIWAIYDQTGFLDYVGGMPAGQKRQSNLHALYERAASYEQNGFKGLFRFVQFIERMQRREEDLATTSPAVSENSVHVMTIHGSKGLQFPVVYLNNISKKFNEMDANHAFILDDKLGIGLKYLDPDTRKIAEPLQYQLVRGNLIAASRYEEMRKLYVAITRAEQKLILVGKVSGDIEKILPEWQISAGQDDLLPLHIRKKADTYLKWLGPAIARHPQIVSQYGGTPNKGFQSDTTKIELQILGQTALLEASPQRALPAGNERPNPQEELQKANPKIAADDEAWFSEVLNLNYPHQQATVTTSYQSVSEVKRLFEDPDNLQLDNRLLVDLQQQDQANVELSSLDQPQFLAPDKVPGAAAIGTATHLILQQMDLTQPVTEAAVTSLIAKLVTNQIVDSAVAKRINVRNILAFYQSELGQLLIAHPDTTYREVPFSMLMNANQVFKDFEAEDSQKILIHGVIDGYVVFDDQVILFDYKTDNADPATIKQRYAGQIKLYQTALTKVLTRPVTKAYLYSLRNNQLISVPN